jgi:hypothetical protein
MTKLARCGVFLSIPGSQWRVALTTLPWSTSKRTAREQSEFAIMLPHAQPRRSTFPTHSAVQHTDLGPWACRFASLPAALASKPRNVPKRPRYLLRRAHLRELRGLAMGLTKPWLGRLPHLVTLALVGGPNHVPPFVLRAGKESTCPHGVGKRVDPGSLASSLSSPHKEGLRL